MILERVAYTTYPISLAELQPAAIFGVLWLKVPARSGNQATLRVHEDVFFGWRIEHELACWEGSSFPVVISHTPFAAEAFGECDTYYSGSICEFEDGVTFGVAGVAARIFGVVSADRLAGGSGGYFLGDLDHAVCCG